MFGAEDFAKHHYLKKGYVGPQGLRDVQVLADVRVVQGSAWVTGANRKGMHVKDAVVGRDFTVDRWLDVATIADGDPCPRCASPLATDRAVEIGHIFQLGRKYTDAFGLDVNGSDGQLIRVTMGSYGIGVSRAVAAVAEQTLDDSGLCWPREIAPAHVHLVPVGKPLADGRTPLEVAEELARKLTEAGYQVLLDDRGVAAGVSFADADLIGVPTIVTLGKSLVDGEVELKDRRTGERTRIPLGELSQRL